MKKLIILITLLFSFISCEKEIDLGLIEETAHTAEITAALQGNYDQCIPSALYAGYYAQYSLTVSGNKITLVRRLDDNNDCSSPYYDITSEWNIEKAKYIDSAKEKFDIDVSMIAYKENYHHSWYTSQNYCGLTDWAVGVEKNLTGLSCPTLLSYDSHHSSFPNAGDKIYMQFTLNSSTVSFPVGFDESGDSPTERRITQLATINKL